MITKTEDAKKWVRDAYQEKNADKFGVWVMLLLGRGYTTKLGPKGGISFQWVGSGDDTVENERKRIVSDFAPHFGIVEK